jgi:hypothetical protein
MQKFKCTICATPESSVQHLDLAVLGSEGVDVCPSCRILVCNAIHDMAMEYQRQRRDAVISRRSDVE